MTLGLPNHSLQPTRLAGGKLGLVRSASPRPRMSIRILCCAPMSPWLPRWHVGAPCLLVETDQGPVLVDTGLGLHDYQSPSWLVRFFRVAFGMGIDPEMAAVRQLSRLGYQAGVVQHIVLTHLHFDHAGGLPDFPHAQVHVHRSEYEAMLHPRKCIELGYNRSDFAHGPRWVLYGEQGEEWLGLNAIKLPFVPEMYLVPLFGHTRGHCGVAIRDGNGWLLQCADALPANAEFDVTPDWLNRLVIGPHVPHLRAWSADHPEVHLLAGHMWQAFFNEHVGGPTARCSPGRTPGPSADLAGGRQLWRSVACQNARESVKRSLSRRAVAELEAVRRTCVALRTW
jgi:glyoxylase-like metal-dependent hydrolase (beta-lactamase superfamily II)